MGSSARCKGRCIGVVVIHCAKDVVGITIFLLTISTAGLSSSAAAAACRRRVRLREELLQVLRDRDVGAALSHRDRVVLHLDKDLLLVDVVLSLADPLQLFA